jgi:hypothetical protein
VLTASEKARVFINRLIVKPIPQRHPMPIISYIVVLLGNLHNFNLTAKYVNNEIPNGFPIKSPRPIPRGTELEKEVMFNADKSISALKNANNGNIINAEKP